METFLIALLAIVAPYPVAGVAFGTALAFAFYAAVIVAAVAGSPPAGPWARRRGQPDEQHAGSAPDVIAPRSRINK